MRFASTFWATYLGRTIGSKLAFAFGAVAVLAVAPGADTMDAVKQATGPLGLPMLVLFLLSVISHSALNLYGAVLAIIRSLQTFVHRWVPTAKARAVLSMVILIASCYGAIGAPTNFVGTLVNLVLALLVVRLPWTSIDLIDFYVINKGKYEIQSIFGADGGIYGRFNPQALIAYAVGIAVQIPFVNTPMYAGPVPKYLGGADLSWIIGLLLTSPLHYWLASRDGQYRRRQAVTGGTNRSARQL